MKYLSVPVWLGFWVATLASQAVAGFDEAVTAANDGNFALAYGEFSALAEQGDARAQQALAWMYYEGQGRPRDYGQAVYWYQKAAEQGNVTAQINLAQMYAYGQGVVQDFAQAAHWWERLAEQGDSRAQSALAGLYYQGVGVVQDIARALALWGEAARQGIIDAQRNLGLLYGKGQGVPQDDVQAYAWLSAAALQDDGTAAQSRDYALSQLTAEQRNAAEALAKEYAEKYVEPFREKNARPH
ncbi:MAG: tetratricopeptide repeat protein [Gammaproteobacteria bacterium]|nr:tetratricopeptide repeat protein [Gammaproteobacteria bacterium]